jgi:hypothetical protein
MPHADRLNISCLHTRRCLAAVRQSETHHAVDRDRYPHFHLDRSVKLGRMKRLLNRFLFHYPRCAVW